MGCDIHTYIEYRRKGAKNWCDFGGRINPGRNYFLFGRLADGVRGDGPAVVPARGVPEDAGYSVRDDGFLFITEDGEGDDYCTVDQASQWSPGKEWKIHDRVPHPDWHSHSWATPDEWEEAIRPCMAGENRDPEYVAILSAMRTFEQMGYDTRIVFWFDN